MPVCPICEKNQPDGKYRPFCSKRCADVDLGRWFSGRYVMPGAEETDDEDTPPRDDGG